jgi:L-arabonate dehydrase
MTAHELRSRNWFGRQDLDGFVHRSWLKAEGFSDQVFDGRPVVGIANSWSELTNCNAHLRLVADAVKRDVWSAGGFPVEFPTISLGEVLMKPTTMLFRNLMAMDGEECTAGVPRCSRTTPTCTGASTIPPCPSTRPPSSCSSTSVRRAPRACRSGVRRRFPRVCSSGA